LQIRKLRSKRFVVLLVIIIFSSVTSSSFIRNGNASPSSNYFYKFTVDREGFTTVEINFNSTDATGDSWVFVPKNHRWNLFVAPGGEIVQSDTVATSQVIDENLYFYQAFTFRYQSSGFFNMTIKFDFDNGALIMEPRGIFYSPQIGFRSDSDGEAEVLFDENFEVNNPDLAVVQGSRSYQARDEDVAPRRVLFSLQETVVRLQVEFRIDSKPAITTLRSSDNKTFVFNTVSRYETYARNVLRFYDKIYNQTTRLFNVTLDDVVVQWYLPDFQSLLVEGGYVLVLTGGLGEININIALIRTLNGTIEVVAAHELVHRFLDKAGISPNDFLWFHEGMAYFVGVNLVSDFGYEGGESEKNNLENAAEQLIQLLDGENFASIGLQGWTPSYQPPDATVGELCVASYYVVSRLPQIVEHYWFEYYSRFFELVGELPSDFNGVKIKKISELALYLSQAANASVAITLRERWGFTVADLFESPVQDLIAEADKAVSELNPIFQPYKFLAEFVYERALLSAEQGDWDTSKSLLQLSIGLANLAPLLTFLTIIGLLALLIFILKRRSRRPQAAVPPLPPEVFQPPV